MALCTGLVPGSLTLRSLVLQALFLGSLVPGGLTLLAFFSLCLLLCPLRGQFPGKAVGTEGKLRILYAKLLQHELPFSGTGTRQDAKAAVLRAIDAAVLGQGAGCMDGIGVTVDEKDFAKNVVRKHGCRTRLWMEVPESVLSEEAETEVRPVPATCLDRGGCR